jgi:hypothetical protein
VAISLGSRDLIDQARDNVQGKSVTAGNGARSKLYY